MGCEMRDIGVIRKIDKLGRLVLPKEFRNILDMECGTEVEMFADKNIIRVQKYSSSCIFCGRANGILHFNGVIVCKSCIKSMAIYVEGKGEK